MNHTVRYIAGDLFVALAAQAARRGGSEGADGGDGGARDGDGAAEAGGGGGARQAGGRLPEPGAAEDSDSSEDERPDRNTGASPVPCQKQIRHVAAW